ncbi:hypothetical protein K402DRAFT_166302 [Aulographum hederae CBS 113979]|uniref:Uncharacterized protein n=1 Tax=Aulographum hederae CBS 113979 TaxID=1176131 RepID=A0A6G1GR61_9PEZI|nr:hypothetical protein K402DRAFT_166302 [Aulographum hederae CBS 113979]
MKDGKLDISIHHEATQLGISLAAAEDALFLFPNFLTFILGRHARKLSMHHQVPHGSWSAFAFALAQDRDEVIDAVVRDLETKKKLKEANWMVGEKWFRRFKVSVKDNEDGVYVVKWELSPFGIRYGKKYGFPGGLEGEEETESRSVRRAMKDLLRLPCGVNSIECHSSMSTMGDCGCSYGR